MVGWVHDPWCIVEVTHGALGVRPMVGWVCSKVGNMAHACEGSSRMHYSHGPVHV